jgi:hypothetical protein
LIHFYALDAWELYDLEKDPSELHSVYADPAYASTAQELKLELERLRAEHRLPPNDVDIPGQKKSPAKS